MRIVNLVATPEAIRRYHPDARDPGSRCAPGIMSADFPVDPARCKTSLGTWLATHIATTRFDDDASAVVLLLPQTEAGVRLLELQRHLPGADVTQEATFLRVIARLRTALDEIERLRAMYGDALFERRVQRYAWPVFGSRAGGVHDGVDTPEAFFDWCARSIRRTGGVILSAGLGRVRPPNSLIATMSEGRGLELLHQYENEKFLCREGSFPSEDMPNVRVHLSR